VPLIVSASPVNGLTRILCPDRAPLDFFFLPTPGSYLLLILPEIKPEAHIVTNNTKITILCFIAIAIDLLHDH
jgi:hypothetical protein